MIFKKLSKELGCLSTTDLPASPAGIMLAGRRLGKAFCGRQWQEGAWYGSPVSFWREVSNQLKALKQARLITARREGKMLYYSLADCHPREIIHLAMSHVKEES